MYRKLFLLTFFIVIVTVAGSAVQAKLQLVMDFEGLSGGPDGLICNGVLGGFVDTQSNGTGNSGLGVIDGSNAMNIIGHSSGNNARAIGVGGIGNPIENGETGIGFFRIMVRATSREARSYVGLIADATDDPINSTNSNDPMTVPAGFRVLDDGSGGFDVTTTDGSTVLKAGLARGQWYNVWIVADNSADTFDLYLSEAAGPAGEATQPAPEDLVQSAIPFGVATTDPLNGMIFANPTGTGQADRIYIDDIWWDGDQGLKPPTKARNPIPASGATNVPRDVALSWESAPFAVTHDVYFGDVFDDVDQATATADPAGVYKGRVIPNSYTLSERLEFDRTYYWRIDEVNASSDNTVHRGDVWNFRAELFAYTIDNIVATASSSEQSKGAENTVNGSGLDADGLLHGNIGDNNMWLSDITGPQPTWIEFEFQSVQKLSEMWVWNSNESLESTIGLGFKDVTIEYSVDGVNYTTLGATHIFNQAPGQADYAHNTAIDMGGISAKHVKLTANSNFKNIVEQFGLSEVRFFHIPVTAREPSPDLGVADVELDLILGWRAGREAAKHDVYFSDDLQAVADGNVPLTTITETSYGPLALDLGKTYFWRIDEVNDVETPGIWQGNIWDFTTQEYFVLDDFESCDAAENQIWWAWKDGLGYVAHGTEPAYTGNGTGSVVGDETTASFAEETIVHGGNQSMPLVYNNNKQGYLNYSEATMTLSSQRDWTARGVKELSLWFRGFPGSVGSFVEGPVGTFTMTAAGTDIWDAHDEFHFAYKQLSGVGSITARVESVDNTDPWAKAGVMIRETLDAGSKFAAVYITPTNDDGTPTQGCRFQGRTDTDGSATSDTSVATPEDSAITAPYWVKIERDVSGNFRGYYSSNGTSWQTMAWRPAISMGSNVYIGLAVTSHNVALTCEAKISGVQTTGTVTGQWQSQDIGISSNSAESMYVVVGNSAGAPVIVYHDDPAPTLIDTWTEWVIPTQAFADQGVNLTDVDNISVGIGDRNNPQPGGSGTIYIDDIRLYGLRTAAVE
ncbi:MAG TPA: discoidin domain-containing protein [Sedimentisphaerales bacterium]|nr:discoidin domain-containing protein [Sedimentisphaerales bacterium]